MTESYITETEATAYFAIVGTPSEWTAATVGDRDIALINASDWLDRTYGKRWVGDRIDRDQVRDWPGRTSAVDTNGFDIDEATVPVEVQNATAEVANRYLIDPTLTDGDVTERGIKRDAIAADPTAGVSSDITYAGAKPDRQKGFPKVDAMLCRILTIGTNESLGVVSLG